MFIILSCHCPLSSVVRNLFKREPYTPDTRVWRVFKRCGWNEVVSVWRRHCIWRVLWNEQCLMSAAVLEAHRQSQLQLSGPPQHPTQSAGRTRLQIALWKYSHTLASLIQAALSCCFSAFQLRSVFKDSTG